MLKLPNSRYVLSIQGIQCEQSVHNLIQTFNIIKSIQLFDKPSTIRIKQEEKTSKRTIFVTISIRYVSTSFTRN